MRVQFVKVALCGERCYVPGDVVDVPEEVAQRLKAEGAVVEPGEAVAEHQAESGGEPEEPDKPPEKKSSGRKSKKADTAPDTNLPQ